MYKLKELYKQWKGEEPANIQQIPGGGSNRTYFRLTDTEGKTVIGVIAIVCGIISIVAYFLYIGLLGRAKDMLAK